MRRPWEKEQERRSLGERPISKQYLGRMTENEYRSIYDNNIKLGIIFALHKHTPKRMLTMKQIGEIIGWGRCAVKNNLITPSGLTKSGILKTSIKKCDTGVMTKNGRIFFYFNNPQFSQLSTEEVMKFFTQNMTLANKYANKAEEGLLRLCRELYPDLNFKYTGLRKSNNRLSNRKYPDIRSMEYPIVLEHAGTWCHTPQYETDRVAEMNSAGYHCHIVWDYNESQRNKFEIEIREFVEDAIQNIHKLAV